MVNRTTPKSRLQKFKLYFEYDKTWVEARRHVRERAVAR